MTSTVPQPPVGGGSTPQAPLSPTDLAARLNAILDDFVAAFPNLRPHDTRVAKQNATVVRFAPDLINPTIAAATNNPAFAKLNIFDPAEGKLALDYESALAPIRQRLSVLSADVDFSTSLPVAAAATKTLHSYSIMKRLAKQEDGAALRPYVAEMQRVVKRVLNRRRAAPATPSPEPPPADTPAPGAPPPANAPQSFLAPKMAIRASEASSNDDLPEAFAEALDAAAA